MKDATTVTTLVPGKLTVYTYGGFAPVCYKDKDKGLTGLDVFSLENFAGNLKLELVLKEHDFDGIWTLPGKDHCDIAAAGIQRRNDRPIGEYASWSDSYFHVQRSLLVRATDKETFDKYETVAGKKIVVTKKSTADLDAHARYPLCRDTIEFVDQYVTSESDAQAVIVELLRGGKIDAFAEGDVSNSYLAEKYGAGSLALADIHDIAGTDKESFNFVTRNASSGLLEQLNIFIKDNKGRYPLGRKNIQIS
ncbi:substrate-binding periplasmic protein [Undibacterium sp. Ji83W]|uniref:substrate-binding periplasmic protein n=1 Tax=Undibacterium sp. Ji83W TaxID=3413043 RepID=UPI003BF3623C